MKGLSRKERLLCVWRERERHRIRRLTTKRRLAKRRLLHSRPLDIWPQRVKVVAARHRSVLVVPKVFSFIDNPIETIRKLDELRAAAGNRFVRSLHIDHTKCEKLDLCASAVMDVLILRALGQRRKAQNLSLSGTLSGRNDVDTMIRASGILKQIRHPASIYSEEPNIIVCDLYTGCAGDPSRTTKAELAATKLTEYFDRCLRREEYGLTKTGQNYLSSLISEVIANAEEHSHRGGGKLWYTIAHYNRLPGDAGGVCHVVLFNFGDSIYESFYQRGTSQEMNRDINHLLEKHRSHGFLGVGKAKWDAETLCTLYALQEGISRLRGMPGGEDRGNGTVEVIEFFTNLADKHPQMALISGKAFIQFDGTYRLRPEIVGTETRKIIAFNDDNSLELPPDEQFVQSLPVPFPGTLITMKFVLNRDHLRSTKGANS